MSLTYQPIIGLEIHVELKTKSKMFSDCPADYWDKEPNSMVCPVSLGLPGALPVPNRQAIDWTIKICQALNCQINRWSKFDRKHYFYPDLPKGYQISQYDKPFGYDGNVTLHAKNENTQKTEEKTFRIRRVHLEEDTGKSIHQGEETLLDYNRSGVPLVEIVTEPDFHSAEDVKRFLEELQVIIRYLGVSDVDMEKGSMRLEPNISVREIKNLKLKTQNEENGKSGENKQSDSELPPYKVEVKNINSFNYAKRAVEYEIKRHIGILEEGEIPKQETRGYNETKGITVSQRSKEEAHDYRYFPEPDIPPIVFTDKELDTIRSDIPELPGEKVKKYMDALALRFEDALVLTRSRDIAEYFESILTVFRGQSKPPASEQDIANTVAKLIVNKKLSTDLSPEEFAKQVEERMKPKETDMQKLNEVIKTVISENDKVVQDYKAGKENAIMFLVGQVMKGMRGQADAGVVKQTLQNEIS